MVERPDLDKPSTKLEALRVTLEMASELMSEIATDPLLGRLIQVFQLLPAEDRGVIVDVLERETLARRRSRAAAGVTGQSMHPNPNARLYVRAHSLEPAQRPEHDEIMIATLRVLRIMPLLGAPDIRALWRAATREALGHVEDDVHAAAASMLAEALELVAAFRAPKKVAFS